MTAEVGLLAEEFIPGEQPPIEWQLWIMSGRIEFVVVQQRRVVSPLAAPLLRVWAGTMRHPLPRRTNAFLRYD